MRAIRSARFVLWLCCVLAYFAATYAADRSPANMANAANTFLSSLTPDQKQVAAYAFDNVAERERFGFVPTEMHPRVGLTIEKMTPPQREAAHNLLKSPMIVGVSPSNSGAILLIEIPNAYPILTDAC